MVIESPWPTQSPYPRAPLAPWLEDAALRWGDKVALIDGRGRAEGPGGSGMKGREYTFRQAFDLARRIGRFLQEQGIAKGDRVAVVSFNCAPLLIHYLGILWAGGTVLPLSPLYKERELKHILADSGAKMALAAGEALSMVDGMKGELPELEALYPLEEVEARAAVVPPEPRPLEIDPEDTAVLLYTGGTTGLPKGAPRTSFELIASVRQLSRTRDHKSIDTNLVFSPLHLPFALIGVGLCGLSAGTTQVMMPRFNPDEAMALIERHRVTNTSLASPALRTLTEGAERGLYDPSSLSLIISGGSTMPGDLLERAQAALGCVILDAYGLSETSATNTPPILGVKPGSIGPPMPDTLEKIISPDTGEEVDPGEAGELVMKGPQVFKGYWQNPEANAEAFTPDGWFRTGDLVRADEDGYCYVVGRTKEIIKYKGYQVAPVELEAVLAEHPAVREAAVIPKKDAQAGELPKALVVLRPGTQAAPEELMAFVEARVAPYKKVREVEFVESIPRSPLGKILRRELIERERNKT